MINKTFSTCCLFAISLAACNVFAHGTPIHIDVVDDQLIASHPPVIGSYAPPVFGQTGATSNHVGIVSNPNLGSIIVWQLPGLEITDMDPASSLSIEILVRPVVDSPTKETRFLWYWNPTSATVESSSSEFHLLGTESRFVTLDPTVSVAPPAFRLADPVAGFTTGHTHALLSYALDNDAGAAPGVYGFFARFTSNTYASSDPFLLVFNYLTDHGSLVPASSAIYAAGTLPGDFDLDDKVDGRDFLVWQRLYGSTTRTVADISLNGVVDAADLAIWQTHYGEKFGDPPAISAAQVPEASGLLLCITAFCWIATVRRQ
jgi:hypothetical protein